MKKRKKTAFLRQNSNVQQPVMSSEQRRALFANKNFRRSRSNVVGTLIKNKSGEMRDNKSMTRAKSILKKRGTKRA